MTSLPAVIGLTAGVILVTEISLWILFNRNYRGMLTEEIPDATAARAWSSRKLSVIVIIHTLLTLAVCIFFLLSVW